MLNFCRFFKSSLIIEAIKRPKNLLLYGDEIILPHKPVKAKLDSISSSRLPVKNISQHKTMYDFIKERYLPLITDIKDIYSAPSGIIRIEGLNAISDAIKLGCVVDTVYFTNRSILKDLPYLKIEPRFIYLKNTSLKKISSLKTPQSVIIDVRPKSPEPVNQAIADAYWKPIPIYIILDSISDPRNIGLILRIAAVFGVQSVYLTKGCANPWTSTSIRAGMTAQFQVPFQTNVSWEFLFEMANRKDCPTAFHVADIAPNLTQQKLYSINIDTPLEHQYQNTTRSDIYDDSEFDDRNHETISKLNLTDESYKLPLKSCPHFAMEYFLKNPNRMTSFGIIFGNESHGISSKAYHLSHYSGGHRIFVPSAPHLSSLNVAMAVSCILSEVQRQYLMREI